MENRFQRVVIDGQSSNELPVQTGVPQGSILGPLVFLIYIDDIIDKILCDIRLFADDTCLLEIVHNAIESARRLNSDLKTLHMWSIQWLMLFNFIKTVILTISRRKKSLHHPDLVLDCSTLQEFDQHCHLGVVFNKSLTWDSHMEYILKKKLFTCRIRPIIENGNFIYDNCYKYLSNRLEQLQMKAARICTGAMRQTSADKILTGVGWERLECRRKFHKLIMFFKMTNNIAPPYLTSICPPTIASTSRYLTRYSQSIRVPRCKTSLFKKKILPSTIRHWNGLDIDVRNSNSSNIFKSKLKLHFRFSPSLSHIYTGYRKASIYHTRLRLGMSSLAAHLFPYGSSDTPYRFCGARETTPHFLLECPHHVVQRTELLVAIRDLIAPNTHHSLLPTLYANRLYC